MEEYATRFADLLENSATKVRSLTVDRANQILKIVSLGLVAAMLGLAAVLFLLIGLFRLLSIPFGATAAYAILGGLFVIAGAFLWARRTREPEEPNA